MGRISRQAMFMGMARMASQRSTCSRLNVGAIVTFNNSPVSIGWNGAGPGEPHCAGNDCPGMTPGNCPSIHAEFNALNKASEILDRGEKVSLYVTHSPCLACVGIILNCRLQVQELFFEIPYREQSPLEVFRRQYESPMVPGMKRRTEVYEITPAGYIVQHFSRAVVEIP